jgi:3-keto-L-gulonate-6-phosphate decarboxylase
VTFPATPLHSKKKKTLPSARPAGHSLKNNVQLEMLHKDDHICQVTKEVAKGIIDILNHRNKDFQNLPVEQQ